MLTTDKTMTRTQLAEIRRNARFQCTLMGTIRFGQYQFHCQMTDISLGGAGIRGFLIPRSISPGTCVLRIGSLPSLAATVKWRRDDWFGTEFTAQTKANRELQAFVSSLALPV